jgi:hypothetical protein
MKNRKIKISRNTSHAKGFFEKPFPQNTQRTLEISSEAVSPAKAVSFK